MKRDEIMEYIRRVETTSYRDHKALYKCICGKETIAFEKNVKRGTTTSCGHIWQEVIRKPRPWKKIHGMSNGSESGVYGRSKKVQ